IVTSAPARLYCCTAELLCYFFILLLSSPASSLFPYTTLFRSEKGPWLFFVTTDPDRGITKFASTYEKQLELEKEFRAWQRANPRSEEHTSELQSRENLVCRLLLEKKKMMILCYAQLSHRQNSH